MNQAAPPPDEDTAIATRFLDQLAESLMAADFDAYANMIDLPFIVTTRLERFVSTTREELHRGFETWQRTIKVNSATQLIQRVHQVERMGPAALIVDYDTDLLHRAQRMLPTFTNWMFLRQHDDGWRVEQLLSGVANRRQSLFIEIDPHNPVPMTGVSAEMLHQSTSRD